MNCGLGNLDSIKKAVLAPSLADSTQYDQVLAGIGRGVAGLFDVYCNRSFAYAENYTEQFMGNRAYWYVKKYPFVSFAAVELRYFATDNWNDISSQPLIIQPESGMFNFGYTLGPAPLQVRVTYTGGYWFQTLEPDDANYQVCDVQTDAGYPAALPQAIQNSPGLSPPGIESYKFLLPSEIRQAWLLECQNWWAARDKLGLGTAAEPQAQSAIYKLDLSPMVKRILDQHKRYAMT